MKTSIKTPILLAAAVLCSATALPSFAQESAADQAIKHRRAAFTVMGTYFGRIKQVTEGARPFNAAQVKTDAQRVDMLRHLPWEGFIAGTDQGNTKAKEDIWLEEERFKKLATELSTKTAALSKAAESGDLKQIKTAFDQTAEACSTCHKAFKKK